MKKTINKTRGMTYVELIVVLSIFSVISTIVIFNYKEFQAKVDIRNLANDVALKIVQAQKNSTTGDLSDSIPTTIPPEAWKPSYGLYFDVSTPRNFIYFTDLNNVSACDDPGCIPPYTLGGEVDEIINITGGHTIPLDGLQVIGDGCPATVTNLSITFKRPSSGAIISSNPPLGCTVNYVSITLASDYVFNAKIRVYPSGRIQFD